MAITQGRARHPRSDTVWSWLMVVDSGQSIILEHFLNVDFTFLAHFRIMTSYIMSHHCYVNWFGQNMLELKVLKVS